MRYAANGQKRMNTADSIHLTDVESLTKSGVNPGSPLKYMVKSA